MQFSRSSVMLTELPKTGRRLLLPWILLPLNDDDRPRAQAKQRSLPGWPLGYDKARRARSGAFLFAPLNIISIQKENSVALPNTEKP
jgi:hypothetical protein